MAGSISSVSDEHVAHAEHEEADDGEAEAEDLDAAHGIDAVERDVDDARDVAGEHRAQTAAIRYVPSPCRCL